MNNHILKCITCKKEFDPKPGLYYCEDCGQIMGTLEVIYGAQRAICCATTA